MTEALFSEDEAGLHIPMPDLFPGVTAHPRPWSWSTLTMRQARDVRAQLDLFVTHYNRTYVVEDQHLLLGCWPLHPGVAHELAALYASWVTAMQSGLSSGDLAMAWHDRWLPGFQQRLPRWYGVGDDRCKPGKHREDWNPSARKLEDAALVPEGAAAGDAIAGYTRNPAHIE